MRAQVLIESIGAPALCAALVVLSLAAGRAQAQSSVYRCTAPDGSIEFRRHPCHGRDAAEELLIEDHSTGWVPPKPAPEPKGKTAKPRPKTADKDRYAARCWQQRQQIERIENELRAGYTVARGERLKRKRREHEAFVNEYCR
ncbi:hypothetical protein [Thiohalocapsa sp. ML1]|jgi:hypothetical protein|uniref:hypothetical protein n=1 Tax=Thiohalocapsa sp. ML1 TaxID=1431688 RepID=UPI0007322880|nr:hypothetical protein [Thiohalocapsa sp. ML1]